METLGFMARNHVGRTPAGSSCNWQGKLARRSSQLRDSKHTPSPVSKCSVIHPGFSASQRLSMLTELDRLASSTKINALTASRSRSSGSAG